jgi:hypothetical protein
MRTLGCGRVLTTDSLAGAVCLCWQRQQAAGLTVPACGVQNEARSGQMGILQCQGSLGFTCGLHSIHPSFYLAHGAACQLLQLLCGFAVGSLGYECVWEQADAGNSCWGVDLHGFHLCAVLICCMATVAVAFRVSRAHSPCGTALPPSGHQQLAFVLLQLCSRLDQPPAALLGTALSHVRTYFHTAMLASVGNFCTLAALPYDRLVWCSVLALLAIGSHMHDCWCSFGQ